MLAESTQVINTKEPGILVMFLCL